jgi:hypothetical protein
MSSHRGGTNAKFDSAPRRTKFDDAIRVGLTKPGPGYYKAGSEFGLYDGDVYNFNQMSSTVRHSLNK